jgi:GH18 family chitinase
MSFSIYINSSDKNANDQIEDLKSNFIINTNTRVILASANFNITNTDSIPGIDNMSTDDVNSLIDTLQALYKTHNKDDNAKVSLSIGGKYHFANSELYNKPTELANNINELVTKFKFDGVDFSITDSLPVPSDFVNNVSLLINTLRSINPKLYITLTTEAQAWESWNYER